MYFMWRWFRLLPNWLYRYWSVNRKIQQMLINNCSPIVIATALSKVLEQVWLSGLAKYVDCRYLIWFQASTGDINSYIYSRANSGFYCNQDTPVYMCFLDARKTFDRVNNWILANKLSDWYVPLHSVKLFIFWCREQEFMVRWSNSLSMTFRCSNLIRQESPLLYNVYTDDLNHHLQAACIECYVGGAWVNSLSYADDVVLLAPIVTALQTLGGTSRMCWTSGHCI